MGEGKETQGLLPRAKTEPEFLELSLKGLFSHFSCWVGAKAQQGPSFWGVLPVVLARGGLASLE